MLTRLSLGLSFNDACDHLERSRKICWQCVLVVRPIKILNRSERSFAALDLIAVFPSVHYDIYCKQKWWWRLICVDAIFYGNDCLEKIQYGVILYIVDVLSLVNQYQCSASCIMFLTPANNFSVELNFAHEPHGCCRRLLDSSLALSNLHSFHLCF